MKCVKCGKEMNKEEVERFRERGKQFWERIQKGREFVNECYKKRMEREGKK